MTSTTWGHVLPSWMPWARSLFSVTGGALPGIVQLGFALSLGVILDTFIVRPVLVPAFLALLCRWRGEQG
jgi:RND superfamily putative drug exporter